MLKLDQSMPIKNFVGLITLLVLIGIAMAAPNFDKYNSGIKISNASKNSLTFSIGKHCSSKMGLINGHTIKVIARDNIVSSCRKNPSKCKMIIYASANCTGDSIATLTMDVTKRGVTNIEPPFAKSYRVSANGFNIFIDGQW